MSKRELHFQIGVIDNKAMGAWDMVLQVGGFKNRAAAEAFGEELNRFMEENANATSQKAQ